ncbi:iron-siderophore ABC transporter substrate-binding protein [Occultella gossypii]|uniref:Iron-siderophore ABC transporter substrate-binding protein n=1 Tax=Occultella gossypii TaxID=2800820 RepID=A0ABS7S3V2_9MICO|nr:iron-siderophore ABC transporter substrate-binding protein [Occultella gossypii]MBZ2195029.1 iron-siderophore ABC transporter substrate-binding protein [Occultella gossypii]
MSRRPIYLVAAATLTTLALAACSGGDGGGDDPTDGGSAAGGDWENVTIEHALGTTEITEAPENVVTLGWGSTEAALALGVVPAGIEAQTYAVNDEGLLPWVAETLDEQGASPTIIPATVEEPAYEDIDDLNPDLILAPYSGITQEQYDLLSEIAPTVAYPDAPWTTPWRELITIVGQSLGLDEEAATVISDLDAEVAAVAQAHPELEGITVAAVWDIGGTFYVYKPADSRVDFLLDLGLVSAPSVEALDSGGETFVYSLSYEQTDQLDAQLIVNYASTETEVETFLAQSYAQAIPAVQAGAIANITGDALIAAMSPPTALSLTWGLEDYATTISEAAANVQ